MGKSDSGRHMDRMSMEAQSPRLQRWICRWISALLPAVWDEFGISCHRRLSCTLPEPTYLNFLHLHQVLLGNGLGYSSTAFRVVRRIHKCAARSLDQLESYGVHWATLTLTAAI